MWMDFDYVTWWAWFRQAAMEPGAALSATAPGARIAVASSAVPPLLTPTDDVVGWCYTADSAAVKAAGAVAHDGRSTQLLPFLTRNMRAFRVASQDVLAAPHIQSGMYPNGLYVVMEACALSCELDTPKARAARDRAVDQKMLFAVFPTAKQVMDGEGRPSTRRVLCGDHFSLLLKRDRSSSKAMNVHATRYQDWIEVPSTTVGGAPTLWGKRDPSDNSLPRTFRLPATPAAFRTALVRHAYLRPLRVCSSLHALLWRPRVRAGRAGHVRPARADDEEAAAARSGSASVGGGAGKRNAGRRRAQAVLDALKNAAAPTTFAQLWQVLPLRKVVVFGVRRQVGATHERPDFDFTVALDDRLHHIPNTTRFACGFTLPAAAARDELAVQAAIATAMTDFTWETFEEPPAP